MELETKQLYINDDDEPEPEESDDEKYIAGPKDKSFY